MFPLDRSLVIAFAIVNAAALLRTAVMDWRGVLGLVIVISDSVWRLCIIRPGRRFGFGIG